MSDDKFRKTALGHTKMTLRGEPWPDSYKRPQFILDMMGNYPRFTCWPRNPKEEGRKGLNGRGESVPLENIPMVAGMSVKQLRLFFDSCEQLLNPELKVPKRFKHSCYLPKKDDEGKRIFGERVLRCILVVGKDENNMFYLQMATNDRKGENAPKHVFRDDELFTRTEDDQEPTESGNSRDEFLSWFKSIKDLYAPVVALTFKEEEAWQGNKDKPNRKDKPKDTSPSNDGFSDGGGWD